MFYSFLCRHLSGWAASAVAVVVYSALLILMILLADADGAVFRYMG